MDPSCPDVAVVVVAGEVEIEDDVVACSLDGVVRGFVRLEKGYEGGRDALELLVVLKSYFAKFSRRTFRVERKDRTWRLPFLVGLGQPTQQRTGFASLSRVKVQ